VSNQFDEDKYYVKHKKPASQVCLLMVTILMVIFGVIMFVNGDATLVMLLPVLFVVVILISLLLKPGNVKSNSDESNSEE